MVLGSESALKAPMVPMGILLPVGTLGLGTQLERYRRSNGDLLLTAKTCVWAGQQRLGSRQRLKKVLLENRRARLAIVRRFLPLPEGLRVPLEHRPLSFLLYHRGCTFPQALLYVSPIYYVLRPAWTPV